MEESRFTKGVAYHTKTGVNAAQDQPTSVTQLKTAEQALRLPWVGLQRHDETTWRKAVTVRWIFLSRRRGGANPKCVCAFLGVARVLTGSRLKLLTPSAEHAGKKSSESSL